MLRPQSARTRPAMPNSWQGSNLRTNKVRPTSARTTSSVPLSGVLGLNVVPPHTRLLELRERQQEEHHGTGIFGVSEPQCPESAPVYGNQFFMPLYSGPTRAVIADATLAPERGFIRGADLQLLTVAMNAPLSRLPDATVDEGGMTAHAAVTTHENAIKAVHRPHASGHQHVEHEHRLLDRATTITADVQRAVRAAGATKETRAEIALVMMEGDRIYQAITAADTMKAEHAELEARLAAMGAHRADEVKERAAQQKATAAACGSFGRKGFNGAASLHTARKLEEYARKQRVDRHAELVNAAGYQLLQSLVTANLGEPEGRLDPQELDDTSLKVEPIPYRLGRLRTSAEDGTEIVPTGGAYGAGGPHPPGAAGGYGRGRGSMRPESAPRRNALRPDEAAHLSHVMRRASLRSPDDPIRPPELEKRRGDHERPNTAPQHGTGDSRYERPETRGGIDIAANRRRRVDRTPAPPRPKTPEVYVEPLKQKVWVPPRFPAPPAPAMPRHPIQPRALAAPAGVLLPAGQLVLADPPADPVYDGMRPQSPRRTQAAVRPTSPPRTGSARRPTAVGQVPLNANQPIVEHPPSPRSFVPPSATLAATLMGGSVALMGGSAAGGCTGAGSSGSRASSSRPPSSRPPSSRPPSGRLASSRPASGAANPPSAHPAPTHSRPSSAREAPSTSLSLDPELVDVAPWGSASEARLADEEGAEAAMLMKEAGGH